MAVLFRAGVHVPLMPFVELAGKAASVAPEQIGPTGVNVGVTIGLTVIVIVVVVTQEPVAFGVKVYVVVAVLFRAGDQVPAIPLLEVVGKAGIVAPAQTGATWLKVGTVLLPTVMVMVAVVAHCPAVGVKV